MQSPPPLPEARNSSPDKKKKRKKKSSHPAADDVLAPPPAPILQPAPHAPPDSVYLTAKKKKQTGWARYLLGQALSLAIGPTVLQGVLVVLGLSLAWWWLQGVLSSFIELPKRLVSLVGYLPHSVRLPGVTKAVAPLVGIYCSTIGIGCRTQARPIGGVARTVKMQAVQAMDLFDSVLQLGGPNSVGTSLHHVALWELAVAVKHTSGLEGRDFLGSQLEELGDTTRDVKDEVTRLNSLGINSFTWILHEFTRVEQLIARAHANPSAKFNVDLDKLLDSLFEKISSDLNALLKALDNALPLADRASQMGGRLSGALAQEYSRVREEHESVPIWKRLVDQQGFKGKQLRRDLELSNEGMEWVKDVRMGLEQARSAFVEYSSNVGHFKAGMMGYHLAGHGLSAEEEVASMQAVMSQFRSVLDEVKQTSKSSRRPKQAALDGSGT